MVGNKRKPKLDEYNAASDLICFLSYLQHFRKIFENFIFSDFILGCVSKLITPSKRGSEMQCWLHSSQPLGSKSLSE